MTVLHRSRDAVPERIHKEYEANKEEFRQNIDRLVIFYLSFYLII